MLRSEVTAAAAVVAPPAHDGALLVLGGEFALLGVHVALEGDGGGVAEGVDGVGGHDGVAHVDGGDAVGRDGRGGRQGELGVGHYQGWDVEHLDGIWTQHSAISKCLYRY